MLSALARTLRLPMQPPAPVRLMAKRAAQAPKPRDSAKVANLFKRGARGLFGGKMIQFGNIISFSNKKWPTPPPATTHTSTSQLRACISVESSSRILLSDKRVSALVYANFGRVFDAAARGRT